MSPFSVTDDLSWVRGDKTTGRGCQLHRQGHYTWCPIADPDALGSNLHDSRRNKGSENPLYPVRLVSQEADGEQNEKQQVERIRG
jgi:hypothetical protein